MGKGNAQHTPFAGWTPIPFLLAAAVFVALAWYLFCTGGESGPAPRPAPQGTALPTRDGTSARPDAPVVLERSRVHEPEPRSPLADALNAPGSSVSADLRIVLSLFENHRQALGSLPTGNGPEIVAALSGRNSKGHAALPADHPAIRADGELLDRWGRPFIFHPVARNVIEIRSAGPDGEAYSEDDSLVATGPRPAWLGP